MYWYFEVELELRISALWFGAFCRPALSTCLIIRSRYQLNLVLMIRPLGLRPTSWPGIVCRTMWTDLETICLAYADFLDNATRWYNFGRSLKQWDLIWLQIWCRQFAKRSVTIFVEQGDTICWSYNRVIRPRLDPWGRGIWLLVWSEYWTVLFRFQLVLTRLTQHFVASHRYSDEALSSLKRFSWAVRSWELIWAGLLFLQ